MNEPTQLFNHIVTQRKRTAEILTPWGLKAVYAHPKSKIPITKITNASLMKVKPEDWHATALPYNLLGIMPRDMVDFDLDIRVTDEPSTRAPQWTDGERAAVESEILQPFRDAFKETLGNFDFRAMFGRHSLWGQGHLLMKVAASEQRTVEEQRTRLKQLAFTVNLGHFSVKLEVRQPPRKTDGASFIFMPGSTYPDLGGTYPDEDYCRFRAIPNGPVSQSNNALEAYPLELIAKAVYRAALIIACRPLLGEGNRHETALLISGVLRREVEQTERDRSSQFSRVDAEEVYRALFAGDPEMRDRMQIFETDFARKDVSGLASYKALGERIGEDTAKAIQLMLSGRDMSVFDQLRTNIVFIRAAGAKGIDLSLRTGSGSLPLQEYAGIRNNYAEHRMMLGRKEVYIFDMLKNSRGRRQVEDVIEIPGYERGAELFQAMSGELSPERQNQTDQHLINISTGWATPYDPEDQTLPRAEARQQLEEMCSWLAPDRAADRRKLFQMWAFKVQNPLVKPQFALGVYGGQGIGKNFVLGGLMQRILGRSVKETSADDLFGKDFSLNAVIGASFVIVDEVEDLVNFGLAKGLSRNEWHEINVKFQGKGQHRVFAIPIYLTNAAHPQFNQAGEVDRTLYIIKAPTQTSLKMSREAWFTFIAKRKQEVVDKIEWLNVPSHREAVMAVLMEYPVTQQELENISTSDSLTDDYLADDLNPEQLALRLMLEQDVVHPKADGRRLSVPFDKQAFDSGFNYYYMQYAGRNAKPLPGKRISHILIECLGEVNGKLQSHRPHDGKRIYWFPARLGSLCAAFDETRGGVIPRETPAHEETGVWTPDASEIRNAIASWSRVDTNSNF